MTPRPGSLAAVGSMLLAVALFALMDAGMKLLTAHYPPLQVAALRGLASLPPVLVWVLLTATPASLLRVHWPLHLLRGALGIGMMAGFVYGLRALPLSTAYSIVFVAPMLVTAMAGPLLRERIGAARWIAIALGMLGVLVILRPGGGALSLAGLAVLGGTLCYAVSAITVRMLAQRDSSQALVLWFLVVLSLGAGLLAAPDWVPLRGEDALTVAGVGLTGALAQVALTEAFRRGEASLIAPLEYTSLVWVVALDLLLWGTLPDRVTWLGVAIIVAGGLYLLRHERRPAEVEHP